MKIEKKIRIVFTLAFIVGLILAGLLGAMGCASFENMRSQYRVDMVAMTMQSVVKVIASGYEDMPASGFYIGNGIVITAGHVTKEESIYKVVFENGDESKVLERIVHEDFDVGFLRISEPNCPALVFDKKVLKRGESVYILGHPRGATFAVSRGIVSGRSIVAGHFGYISLLITDAIAYRGNSGSVVVDEQGEIRGVYVGTYRVSIGGTFPAGCSVFICTADILKAYANIQNQ